MLEEIKTILSKEPTFKNLKNNSRPNNFSKTHLDIVKEGFSISVKADGLNVLLMIDPKSNKSYSLGLSEDMISVKLDKSIMDSLTDLAVFDCEYFEDFNKFLVFDVLILNKTKMTDLPFYKRYTVMNRTLKNFTFKDQVSLKKFYFPKKEKRIFKYACDLINLMLSDRSEFEIDGLIFMPIEQSYYDKNIKIYKWKPEDKLTVDFLCKKTGIDTYDLMVGINPFDFKKNQLNRLPWFKSFKIPKQKYFPILFRPKKDWPFSHVMKGSLPKYKDLDDMIVECLWNGDHWTPVLVREDKTELYNKLKSKNQFAGANNWKVAISTFKDALNPVTYDDFKCEKS